jgi:uncharacterized protein YecT (DUF1311 family)
MTRFLAVATVLALLAAAPAVEAQPRRPARSLSANEAIVRCDRAGGGNMEMMACVAEILDREDARLNWAYKAAMSRLPPPQRVSLRNAQRRWIRDRDVECAKEGGDFAQAGIYVTMCHVRLTETRADELERNGRRSR